jgi:hypothetical protein
MIVTIHKRGEKMILAVCDEDILGKCFEQDHIVLDLTGTFYKGVPLPLAQIGELMRNAQVINVVGSKSVAFGLQENIITKNNVKSIQDVPYAHASRNL